MGMGSFTVEIDVSLLGSKPHRPGGLERRWLARCEQLENG